MPCHLVPALSHIASKTFMIIVSFSEEDMANLQQETAVPGNRTTEISLSEIIGNFWKNTECSVVPSAEEQLKISKEEKEVGRHRSMAQVPSVFSCFSKPEWSRVCFYMAFHFCQLKAASNLRFLKQ